MASITWAGADKLIARLRNLAAIPSSEFVPLMEDLQAIIVEDNRKGVLAGLDRDGNPLAAVKYRTGIVTSKTRARARRGDQFGAPSGDFKGAGPLVEGLHGNLSPAEYRALTGPPLAPRGTQSRVITNLTTDAYEVGPQHWEAIGFWDEIVSNKGVPFLAAHFEGRGRLPRRDLRGLRPWGRRKAGATVRAWALYQMQRG